MCRTQDIVVPEYVSGSESDSNQLPRYQTFQIETDDISRRYYAREYYLRISLGTLAFAADVWEVKDVWWISEEVSTQKMGFAYKRGIEILIFVSVIVERSSHGP